MLQSKRISHAFSNLLDTKRIIREIKLLKHIKHENIISIIDIFRPPSKIEFEDVYIVSELMDTDLHQIINSLQPLSDDHLQYFVYQILRGLKFLHSANILHRDLKPSNILCNRDCLIKIADFGLARVLDEQDPFLTEYVATRYYRAPEVILTWKEYTRTIDIWSVGCIFAEMVLRKPLFEGKDYIHQVTRITDITGSPTEEDIINCKEDGRRFMRSLGYKPGIPFQQLFPTLNSKGIDLLHKMLTFNPDKRCTVEEALAHPYLESLHDENDEPTAQIVPKVIFDFEKFDPSKQLYQELVWQEMCYFHPEAMNYS